MSINREHPSKAMETVINAAQLIKDDQVSIGVYPEGTRNTTEEPLLPFHNSIFKIAQMADVPIVVMTAKKTAEIKHNYPKKASDVYFKVTGVIPAEDLKGKKTLEIGERVRELLLTEQKQQSDTENIDNTENIEETEELIDEEDIEDTEYVEDNTDNVTVYNNGELILLKNNLTYLNILLHYDSDKKTIEVLNEDVIEFQSINKTKCSSNNFYLY